MSQSDELSEKGRGDESESEGVMAPGVKCQASGWCSLRRGRMVVR